MRQGWCIGLRLPVQLRANNQLLFCLLLKHFLDQKKPETIIKNGTAWFEKHLIIIVAIGLNDNWLLKCINTTNSAHSNLDMSISDMCVLFFDSCIILLPSIKCIK